MFADPPPAPPPPAYEVIRFETASTAAARRDTPYVYVRGAQTERALLRYQIFLRTEVETRRPTGVTGEIDCAWAIAAFLQRVPCMDSITGQLACGEDYTTRLGDQETGRARLPADQQAACGVSFTSVQVAQTRLGGAVAIKAEALFDEDLAKHVKPELKAAGIVVRPPGAVAAKPKGKR